MPIAQVLFVFNTFPQQLANRLIIALPCGYIVSLLSQHCIALIVLCHQHFDINVFVGCRIYVCHVVSLLSQHRIALIVLCHQHFDIDVFVGFCINV